MNLLKKALLILTGILLGIIFLLGGFILSLKLPAVQNFLLPYVNELVSDAVKSKVEIKYIYIELWNKIVLEDVTFFDQKGQKMIGAKELKIGVLKSNVRKWISGKAKAYVVKVGSVSLEDGYLNLYISRKDSLLNLDFLTGGEDTSSSSTPINIEVGSVKMNNFRFIYRDSTVSDEILNQKSKFNYSNINLDKVSLDASFSLFKNGNMDANIKHLSLHDNQSGFILDSFRTKFSTYQTYTQTTEVLEWPGTDSLYVNECYTTTDFISLKDLVVQTMGSKIHLDFLAENATFATLADSIIQEEVTVNFKTSAVDVKTVNFFLSDNLPIKGKVFLNGIISGDEKKIKSDKFQVAIPGSSVINLSFRLNDYLSGEDLFLHSEITSSSVYMPDLVRLFEKNIIPQEVKNLNRVNLTGDFTGFFDDFVARLVCVTPAGKVNTEFHLEENKGKYTYSGALATDKLNLDKILGMEGIASELNLTGKIEGNEFDFKNMKTKLVFSTHNGSIAGYEIDSIGGDILLDKQTISGPLGIKDQYGNLDAYFNLDLSDTIKKYGLKGDFKDLDLKHYGLVSEPIYLTTILDLQLEGDSLDGLNGKIKLFETYLENKTINKTLQVPKVLISTTNNTSSSKNVVVSSTLGKMNIHGNFSIANATKNAERLVKEITLYIANNALESETYYKTKIQNEEELKFNISAITGNPNELLAFLGIPIFIADSTELKMDFTTGSVDILNVSLESREIMYDSIRFQNLDIKANINKEASSNTILAQTDIDIRNLEVNKNLSFQDVVLEPIIQDNLIEFTFKAKQKEYNNELRFSGKTELLENYSHTKLNPGASKIFIKDRQWTIKEENDIFYYNGGKIIVNDLTFNNADQKIGLDGEISDDPMKEMVLSIQKLRISTINQIFPMDENLNGIVDANFKVANLFNKPVFVLNSSITNLQYMDFEYGTLDIGSNWNEITDVLALKASLTRYDKNLLNLKGEYDRRNKVSPLSFDLESSDLPLNILQPFLEGVISKISGEVDLRKFSITGTLDEPVIVGTGNFSGTRFKVEYTQVSYVFDGQIILNEKSIKFPKIRIYDQFAKPNESQNHFAELYGYIYHSGFQKFRFDLQFEEFKNFMVFNTKSKDNELFYGKTFIKSGIASITGNINLIEIMAEIETGEGTEMSIPLTSYEEKERLSYIRFISPDTKDSINEFQSDLSGIKLDLSINATPAAKIQLIFDEKVGDVISGTGYGNIQLNISPAGEFEMFGLYEIEKGDYLFTSQNLVNKKFSVKKGGRISWNGSPYEGIVNLDAIYKLQANAADLVPGTDGVSGRIPVEVTMNLTGSLMSPQITLGINITQQDNLQVTSKIKSIQSDPGELNRQAFSLLIFNRFAPNASIIGETGTSSSGMVGQGVSASLSELVSNQLNYWFAQTFNSNISVNVRSENFKNLQADISAKFFNDKVTVYRSGSLVSNANSDLSVGNISIQIQLYPPTKPNAKKVYRINPGIVGTELFNRENNTFVSQMNTSRGAGIFYKKDFDRIEELFRKSPAIIPDSLRQRKMILKDPPLE